MKILITDIHHGNGGGHVTYILSLLQGLRHHCDLTLAAPRTGRLFTRASQLDAVRVLPGAYTSRPAALVPEVAQLRGFLQRERFDVVHVNGSADHRHTMLACLGLSPRPAIVWTKHNTNPVSSVGHWLRARFGTDATIAVCDYVANMLHRSEYAKRPVRVVRNGIDIDVLQPATPQERADFRQRLFGTLGPDVLVLGSIGGTDYNKGWLVLMEAIARLPPALQQRLRVVVAGDPPQASMTERVRALGVGHLVAFPGLVSDIRPVLGACDAGFVLSYREAASYASCETMAMALPALVSDAGGLPENVRDGRDGWVVKAGDARALAERLVHMLSQPGMLPVMGRSARVRVEQMFRPDRFLESTHGVYAEARRQARDAVRPL
ncbi:glycosyltransferase family 4 protein [Parapusillimonas sp. SGNA-6]|nr:glycosyltransferase family 4 protein [Parapusillimonas sp. SGNA-6]